MSLKSWNDAHGKDSLVRFFDDNSFGIMAKYPPTTVVAINSCHTSREIFDIGSESIIIDKDTLLPDNKKVYNKVIEHIVSNLNYKYSIAFVGEYRSICRVMTDVIKSMLMDPVVLAELIGDLNDGY
jgi:hypothetical protein